MHMIKILSNFKLMIVMENWNNQNEQIDYAIMFASSVNVVLV